MAQNSMYDKGWFGPDNPFNKGAESAYFSYGNQWKSPNQKKFFQSQFSNIQNQYMGALGQQVRGGNEPTQDFTDFLGNFDWRQNFNQQTPQERGEDTSRFNPWTRWMV